MKNYNRYAPWLNGTTTALWACTTAISWSNEQLEVFDFAAPSLAVLYALITTLNIATLKTK